MSRISGLLRSVSGLFASSSSSSPSCAASRPAALVLAHPAASRGLFTADVKPGSNPEMVVKTLTASMKREGILEFLRFKRYRDRPHRVRNNRILSNRIKKKDEEIKVLLDWMARKRERGG